VRPENALRLAALNFDASYARMPELPIRVTLLIDPIGEKKRALTGGPGLDSVSLDDPHQLSVRRIAAECARANGIIKMAAEWDERD
jgi:hypothetical protein